MNKLFTKIAALFLGMTMAVGVGVAVGTGSKASEVRAGEESVDFSAQGYSNQQVIASYTGTNFSIAFNKGTNSNAPKYYTSGSAIRCYGGNYFTVESENTLTQIVLTFGSSDGSNAITTDVETYSNGTWTGSGNSVKFTIGGTSGNRRLAGLSVTYDGGSTPTTKYDVKFYDGTREYTDLKQSVKEGGYATRPSPNPSKEGYTFDNWYTDTSFDTLFDFDNTVINEPTNIYAKFNALVASNYRVTTLTAGKQVLIVTKDTSGTYYMLPAATTESSPSNATRPTVTNGIISGVYDNNLFTVASSDSNWTFANSSGTNFLVIASDGAQAIRINANQNKTWIYDSSTKSLKNTANNRYLGVYTSGSDWRSYTSSDYTNYDGTGENIQFFEKFEGKITLDSPVPVYNDASKEISWDPIPGASSYQLKIDSGSYSTETSPYSVSTLEVGTHTVSIIAKGNTSMYEDSEPGVLEFSITAPTTIDHVDITTKPTSPVNNETVGHTFTFGATATRATGSAESTFTWASTDTSVATIDASTGVLTYVGNGTTTISAESNYPAAEGKTNIGTFVLVVENLKGSETNPYSVAEARTAIDSGTSITNVCATGIVSEIVTPYSSQYGNITYNISTDGSTTSDQLQAYRGKSYNGESFTSADDIQVGDVVVVKGNLKKHNTTYEFDADNQLVSLSRKTLTKIELSGTYTTSFVEGSEFNHDGVVVTATYDDSSTKDVSSLATFSTPNMTQIGEQTITVTYGDKEATYKITITEREVDSIAVASMPTKTSYYVDDTMNIAGLTITVTYKTGEPATIDSGFTLNPAADYKFTSDDLEAGSKTFTVTYKSKTTTFDVDVVEKPTTIDDELTRDTTGVSGTSYTDWSGKTVTSDAVYAGNSAGGNESIQLRSSNSNSGIITTSSGGKIKKVTVVWNSNTSSGRKVEVYASNTAYASPTELYNSTTAGTKIGTIDYGSTTELTIEGDYAYVGVKSSSGALYLTSITFTWDQGSTPTPAEQEIVSGTFDYNDKASVYVGDYGTIVVTAPDGYTKLEVTVESEDDFVVGSATYDSTSKTASFDFTVGDTDVADFDLTFGWTSNDNTDEMVLIATIQIVNPTGLAEAISFGEEIDAVCGSGSSMKGNWEALDELWNENLSADAKDFLLNAHYDVSGTGYETTVVTKHDDTHYKLANSMSRYDFMVEHYGMTNFMNKSGLSTGERVVINPFVSMGENSNMVAIVVIVSVVSLTAIGGYFFLRKRREQN